ncbi:MAG: phage major capsid protein [Bacteroidetes bacterium]|jgi:hypothetical protein|nr:phage major capsid protein [Bacteroidota bacterium]
MTITTASQMLDPQILVEAVRGRFAKRNAFMGSVLVSQGAVRVSGNMPEGGPNAIGNTITVPYFGIIGDFVNNPDGSSVTPSQIGQTSETATISRDSLAVEVSRWAQGIGAVDPSLGDPYDEAVSQIERSAERAMDSALITEAANTPLVSDQYNSSSPSYIQWDMWVDAKAKFGDEMDGIVAAIVHSRTLADMAKLKDSSGRPLLLNSQNEGQGQLNTFCGVPLVVSDRAPLTGSSMGSVTSTGTTPPTVTLSGTPEGPWNLVVDIVAGGTVGNATFRFSTDGGNTYSATLTTAASVALTDTNEDSLVGNNGSTGVTVAFAAGTYNADNQYTATADLKVTDFIMQMDAMAFWYNAAQLGLKTDPDVLADTDIGAMHLYRAAHLYRRRRGGTRPGCVAVKHNVRNYTG